MHHNQPVELGGGVSKEVIKCCLNCEIKKKLYLFDLQCNDKSVFQSAKDVHACDQLEVRDEDHSEDKERSVLQNHNNGSIIVRVIQTWRMTLIIMIITYYLEDDIDIDIYKSYLKDDIDQNAPDIDIAANLLSLFATGGIHVYRGSL